MQRQQNQLQLINDLKSKCQKENIKETIAMPGANYLNGKKKQKKSLI